MNKTMTPEEKEKRCYNVKTTDMETLPIPYLCRVYGRWVEICEDCAFNRR